ncbi:MAG: VanZ family protein [Clostridiales bacterium]|nr:VanZ family protein [Clostridiales bacterium]
MRKFFGQGAEITGSRTGFRVYRAFSGLMILLIFIFSMMSRETSGNQSSWASDLLAFFTGLEWEDWVIRKLAHFVEYALLGCFAGMALSQLVWQWTDALQLWLASFVIGFLDETIQLFSGRGPAIVDVWLDASGMLFGLGVTLLLVFLYESFKQALKSIQ